MSKRNSNQRWPLGRRDFLRTAIASGIALAAGGLYKLFNPAHQDSVLAGSGTGPYYYGTNGSSVALPKNYGIPALPQNFYIGRTGVGGSMYGSTDPNLDDSEFNTIAASQAGFSFTHSFWLVKGPFYYWRSGRDYYQYGVDQGNAACTAWHQHVHANLLGGRTIFGDIEGAGIDAAHRNINTDDGWTDHSRTSSGAPAPAPEYFDITGYTDTAKNQQVLEGFLDAVTNYNGQLNPGIYTTLDLWTHWFNGSTYDPQRNFVTWLAGGSGNGSCPSCTPCNPACDTKTPIDNSFNTVKNTAFAKMKTVIWQYYLSPGCSVACGDFNIARQDGHTSFNPVSHEISLPIIMSDGGTGGLAAGASNSMGAYPAPETNSSSTDNNTSDQGSVTDPYPAP